MKIRRHRLYRFNLRTTLLFIATLSLTACAEDGADIEPDTDSDTASTPTGGETDADADTDSDADADTDSDADTDTDSDADTDTDTHTDADSDSDTDTDADSDTDTDSDTEAEAYCADPPEYDASGTYAVLRPESSNTVYSTEHFAARWNAQDGVSLSESQVMAGLETLEGLWDFYLDEIGFQPPYLNETPKYKVSVNLSNQGYATGAGTGDHDPEVWLHYSTAFGNAQVMAHEFTHSLQFASRGFRDSEYVGWSWESHAEWMTHQAFPDSVGCSVDLVNAPHIYYGSTRTRYCNWQFWEFLKDKYCYRIINDMWADAPEREDPGYLNADPFSVIAANMGWSVSRLNDEFGDWALHNATWDYQNGDCYRTQYGSYDRRNGLAWRRVTRLEALDLENRRYNVPKFWAPQRWGYNLVRLHPEADAQQVMIKFRGVVQEAPAVTSFGNFENQPTKVPDPDSEWRWGLVALEKSGARRYSGIQRGTDGELTFNLTPDDKELWLAVVATPSEIHKIFWDQMYYTIYRYPWMVQIDGAWPGGFEPDAAPPSRNGDFHANGGGWVDNSASVDDTAYVGPYAAVLGGTVRGNARIEDHALVLSGTVSGNAVVGGITIVDGGRVTDNAVINTVMNSLGRTLSGDAQMHGDMELGVDLSRGVYYGFVDDTIAGNPAWGASRTAPAPEVTAYLPFDWY